MSLAKAIVSAWNSSTLKGLVPGGLYRFMVPPKLQTSGNIEWPHQTFTIFAEPRETETTTATTYVGSFEIQTYVKDIPGYDPTTKLDDIMELVKDTFNNSVLTISGRSAMLTKQTNQASFQEDHEIFRGLNEFEVRIIDNK